MRAKTNHATPSSAPPTLRFLSIGGVAECLDVSMRTVRRWIKAGSLPVHRVGGLVRISEADFAAFLALRRGRAISMER